MILCERGIRSWDTLVRNTFDLSAIPVVHKLSHLPIIADPSHGTGVREHVPAMARAAIASGADGLIIEVHPTPDHALSDGAQSLYPEQFARSSPSCGRSRRRSAERSRLRGASSEDGGTRGKEEGEGTRRRNE